MKTYYIIKIHSKTVRNLNTTKTSQYFRTRSTTALVLLKLPNDTKIGSKDSNVDSIKDAFLYFCI